MKLTAGESVLRGAAGFGLAFLEVAPGVKGAKNVWKGLNVAPRGTATGTARAMNPIEAWGSAGRAHLAERAQLQQIAEDVAKHLERTLKDKIDRGYVLSVLRDRRTGEIFLRQNLKEFPEGFMDSLHPITRQRLQSYLGQGLRRHPSLPGSHSEFLALNDALLRREALGLGVQSLDDFGVYNIILKGTKFGQPIPRCGNCRVLTIGIRVLSPGN